jgi:hypothetical protein
MDQIRKGPLPPRSSAQPPLMPFVHWRSDARELVTANRDEGRESNGVGKAQLVD